MDENEPCYSEYNVYYATYYVRQNRVRGSRKKVVHVLTHDLVCDSEAAPRSRRRKSCRSSLIGRHSTGAKVQQHYDDDQLTSQMNSIRDWSTKNYHNHQDLNSMVFETRVFFLVGSRLGSDPMSLHVFERMQVIVFVNMSSNHEIAYLAQFLI